MSRVAVLGAGSWGTTLAVHLAGLEHQVALWDHDHPHLAQLEAHRENRKFVAGIALPAGIKVQPELEEALAGAEVVVFVVPSHAMRSVCRRVATIGSRALNVCAAKGLELETLEPMTQVMQS